MVNEVRRLYYGIAQGESGRRTLQAAVDFLKQLDRETSQHAIQRVALKADLLTVKAQLVQAEYELLKLDDPIQTQKEQLNRLMGRSIDEPVVSENSAGGSAADRPPAGSPYFLSEASRLPSTPSWPSRMVPA